MKYIVDPSLEKSQLLAEAIDLVQEFLRLNGLKEPSLRLSDTLGHYGLYEYSRNQITINLSRCKKPTRGNGWSWSYPGYKADLTPYGVFCHETGHHVDNCLDNPSKQILKSIVNESKVSSYEPSKSEIFAEAMKVFLTNPNLLKTGRPKRYGFLTEKLKLQPLHDIPYNEVLQFAPDKVKSAAKNWILHK